MPFSKEDYYKIISEDEKENNNNNNYTNNSFYGISLFGPNKYNDNADIFVDEYLYKQQAIENTSNISLFGNNNKINLFGTEGGLFGNYYNNKTISKPGSLFEGSQNLFG